MKIDLQRASMLRQARNFVNARNWTAAKVILDELLAHNRRDVEALEIRAKVEFSTAHYDEAIGLLQNCVSLQPNNEGLQLSLASMLAARGRYGDSIARLRKFLRKHPDDLHAIGRLAEVLESTSEIEEGLAALSPIMGEVHRDPRLGGIYAKLQLKAKNPQEAVDCLLKVTNGPPVPISLFFILAKAYEALGDVDNAFKWYISANQMPVNPSALQGFVDHVVGIMRVFTREFIASMPRARHGSHLPVFIAARPRSGTTLVESILDAHPDAAGAGEFHMIGDLISDAPLLLNTNLTYPECMREFDQGDADRLGQMYLDAIKPIAEGRSRVVDKNLATVRFLGLVQGILPNSKVLHCRRNEVDNCFGIYTEDLRMQFYSTDLRMIGVTHRLFQRLMKHWHEVLDLPILDLDYEELVSDQEGWTRRILEFCGLPWDDRCLRFYEKRNAEKQNVKIAPTLSYDQVRKPMYKTSVGRAEKYKKHLDPLFAGFEEGDRIVKAIDAGQTPTVE